MEVVLEVIFAFLTTAPSFDRKAKRTGNVKINRRLAVFLIFWTCFILLISFLSVRFNLV